MQRRGTLSHHEDELLSDVLLRLLDDEIVRRGGGAVTDQDHRAPAWYDPALPTLVDVSAILLAAAAVSIMVMTRA